MLHRYVLVAESVVVCMLSVLSGHTVNMAEKLRSIIGIRKVASELLVGAEPVMYKLFRAMSD